MGIDLREIEKRWQEIWQHHPLKSPVAEEAEDNAPLEADSTSRAPSESSAQEVTEEDSPTREGDLDPSTQPKLGQDQISEDHSSNQGISPQEERHSNDASISEHQEGREDHDAGSGFAENLKSSDEKMPLTDRPPGP